METLKDYIDGNEEAGDEDSKYTYYYVWAFVDGRLYVDGGWEDERKAYQMGSILRVGGQPVQDFKVIGLRTKTLSVATQRIKHNQLADTGDLLGATKRARHQLD